MDRNSYIAQVNLLNSRPVKEDLPDQKFKRGFIVKIDDKMPNYMSNFPSGCLAVVGYSYAQKFGGNDINSYHLILLDDNNNPVNGIAWYKEQQLTLVDSNLEKGLIILSRYENKINL